MPVHKCKECGATFKNMDPLMFFPVCERCKREKESFKKGSGNGSTKEDDSTAQATAIGFLIVVGILIWVVLKGWGMLTYWDKIYVYDNLKTYSTEEFKTSEIVKFDKDDRINWDVKVYNNKSGEEKEIQIPLPLYSLWTREKSREKLDGKKEVLFYKQPLINDGYDFIKPSDAIIKDSDTFNNIIQNSKILYRKEHIKEFIDWTFNKEEVKK